MNVAADVSRDMRAYYAQRAAYYERVYFKPERQADLRAMEAALPPVFAGRRVLEVACGTGWWTAHGARDARSWLATDINPETLAVARGKPLPGCVQLKLADACTLAELEGLSFDGAFAGCWWSHVAVQRVAGWLALLHSRLEPGAQVVMLDNSFVQTSSTPITRRDETGNSYQLRTLDDGSQHEVLKNFQSADEAMATVRAADPAVTDLRGSTFEHYWMLQYRLGSR